MSNLVKPHVISVVVIAALVVIALIWPAEHTSEVGSDIPAVTEGVVQDATSESVTGTLKPAALPMPSMQVLQPDPGLSEEALFRQAVNARKCRHVPKTKKNLQQWLSQARVNNESPERIARILNAFDSCQTIDAAHDYMSTFKLLARQGHEGALWQFWQLTEKEVFRLKGIRNSDSGAIIAARQAFQLAKYQLAEQQLLLGNERAMMRLMNAYRYLDPATGTQNYVRSLTLANLVLNLSQNQDNYRRADWLKQHLEQRMSAEEAQQALELAQDIAAKLKRS